MSKPVVTIRCRLDGPLVVELPATEPTEPGGIGEPLVTLRLTDHEGGEFQIPVGKKAVALCRCGQTKNRPFCDGTHKTCGYQACDTAPK